MKNIKEYIGKKVAVECENKEDWDKLIKLTDTTNPNYFDTCPSKCFDLEYLGSYWSTTSKQGIIESGYTIYPASDFLKKESKPENLVGRYFKALADNINCSNVIKGNYYQVVGLNERKNITFYTEYSTNVPFAINKSSYHLLEFMPEGWTPESKQYDYEVVHCKTQEEWDFVRNKTSKGYSFEWHEALSYSKELALHIDGKGWSRLSFYKEQNSKIYSFEEWCTKFGYTYKPSTPEYVECIASINGNRDPKVGTIIKAEKDGTLKGICLYNSITYKNCFRPSTKEAYEAQFKKEEPKFKVGDWVCWIIGDEIFQIGERKDLPQYAEYYNMHKDNYRHALPHEIPKKDTNWVPKVGDWVECIKEEGFKSDSKNYLIESGIKLGQKYQVIGYVKEYNYVDGKGIQLNGYNCTHPLTSFKPYQEIPTTAYTGVDYSSPKVTIGNTAIDIIAPKKSNSVTLGQIQKEIKINVNFKKPVKI